MSARTRLLLKDKRYAARVLAARPLAFWPLADSIGLIARDESGYGRDGVYGGVTLANSAFIDGSPVGRWDGVNDYMNAYSAGLAGAFNGFEGSLALWLRVYEAAVWSDGVIRGLIEIQADADNQIYLRKSSSANTLQFNYRAGAVSKSANISQSSTGWLHLALTWSKSADQVKAYVNGAQSGATLTGLGTFAGSPSLLVIGAVNAVGNNCLNGYLALCALWNSVLTPNQIAALAQV